MVKTAGELIATRTTLIQRLKNWQDRSSWQDFFDTYWKLIYSTATKAGLNGSEAQDVVQETMISVAKHMPNFKYDRAVGSFKAWLLNMTRWRITDQLRKRQGLPAHDSPEDADALLMVKIVDPTSETLEAVWDAEWEKNLLDAAIDKVKRHLDPQKYQVFDFYVNKEWSPDDVAKAFGISISQVYLAKHRVTEMITEEVKKLELQMS
jgi:RNA polymerase sigma factor (sigma-70 family)